MNEGFSPLFGVLSPVLHVYIKNVPNKVVSITK
jgi:hypothetical protein